MKLQWTPEALRDLERIHDVIADHDRTNARRWIARFRRRAREGAAMPQSGRRVPEWDRDEIREWIVAPWRLIYRIHIDRIDVVTVIDGRRQLPASPPDAPKTRS